MESSNSFTNFEIEFSDETLRDADGDYTRVKALMEEQPSSKWTLPINQVVVENWVIPSRCIVSSELGISQFYLNLYHNKNIYIIEYSLTSESPSENPSLIGLNQFSLRYGWNRPILAEALIKSNKQFWRQIWEMNLVDSDYLEKRYGPRSVEYVEDEEEEANDEYELLEDVIKSRSENKTSQKPLADNNDVKDDNEQERDLPNL